MGTGSWDRVWEIFHNAVDLEGEARRDYLAEACGDDLELRDEVEGLIAAHEDSGGESLTRSAEMLRRLDPEALVGERVGPYRIVEVIGEGGMGVVYAAEQLEPIKRRVALKLVKLGMDSKEIIGRFETERQALALMDHPNIARVFDAGASSDGRPFFVMEYVPGIPITEYCDRNRLTLQERLRLFIQVCDAVQHAHHKGIIHRDIKPSNVLVMLRDDHPEPKVIDFGVAKALTTRLTDQTLHTRIGRFIGTPAYISPEQAEMGALDVDTRTDIYSLGVLLYELSVGSRPADAADFEGSSPLDIPRLLRETEVPRPSSRIASSDPTSDGVAELRGTSTERLRREVKGDLDSILLQALESDRTRRYASAHEFAADLQRLLNNEAVLARAPSTMYRLRKFVSRHKTGVAAATIVAVAIVVAVAGLSVGLLQAREAQRIAELERNRAVEVSRFVEGILAGANPYVAQGGDTTLLKQLLDQAAERIETEVGSQPRIAAALHDTLYSTYRDLGLFTEAEHHVHLTLEHVETAIGTDSPEAWSARHNLALLYWDTGRLEESLALNEQVLAAQQRLLGPGDPETLSTMNNMGIALKGLGRNEEAEALYLELIEWRNEVLGPKHRYTLLTQGNLANLYRDWDRVEEAEALMRRVVQDAEVVLGLNDPDTIAWTDNLANMLVRLGRIEEAEPMHLDALERMQRVYGSNHPDTLGTVYNIGQMYMAKAEYARAESHFRQAYDGVREGLGPDHRYAVMSSSWLARAVYQQGRRDEAEALYRQTVATSRRAYPSGHVATWVAECRHGSLLIELGRVAEGRGLLDACLPLMIEELGPESEAVLEIQAQLDVAGVPAATAP